MKHLSYLLLIALVSLAPSAVFSDSDNYTFFVRQIQMPDEAEWDVTVAQQGSQQSPLAINPNGARFELWTVRSNPLTSYLLDTTYVNSYVPVADIEVTSEDPYSVIPRTRADRPFTVRVNVNGLSDDPTAPAAAQSVKFLRHVQAYPGEGNGKNVDRGQATLLSQGSLNANGEHVLEYQITSIPGTNRAKVRGEERFSIFSMEDYQAPESQLDSAFIQIWPVADSSISGIDPGQVIKGVAPQVTIDLNDLYPDSWTYAQVYQGDPALGTEGTIVPGTSILIDSSTPRSEKIRLKDWDEVIREDGNWTLEVLTVTPFGIDRLEHLSFQVQRKIRFNGSVTSVE